MGQLVQWMREQGITVGGEEGIEGWMEEDVLVSEVVRGGLRKRVREAGGISGVYWVGQMLVWDGEEGEVREEVMERLCREMGAEGSRVQQEVRRWMRSRQRGGKQRVHRGVVREQCQRVRRAEMREWASRVRKEERGLDREWAQDWGGGAGGGQDEVARGGG